MGPSKKQWPLIRERIRRWSEVLKHAIEEHGRPNSFGVVELAGEYRLQKSDGYYLGYHRILDFSEACGGGVTYSHGRFIVEAK